MSPIVARDRNRVVLIVEDDDQLRQLYRTALTAAGVAVVGVPDGIDVLRYIDQDRPAAVVLDSGLPHLNGFDFYAELAEGLADEIPVVVVTGDARGLRDVGFSCVLHKPIDPHKLERPCGSACRARESPPPRNRPCGAAVRP